MAITERADTPQGAGSGGQDVEGDSAGKGSSLKLPCRIAREAQPLRHVSEERDHTPAHAVDPKMSSLFSPQACNFCS